MPQLSRYLDLVACQLSTAATNAVELATDNCEGVLFVGVPGTTAARIWSLALKAGATTTGFVNCASTHTFASTASRNDVLVVDVHKPAKRYLGGTISSSAATPVWLLAFKYGLRANVGALSSTAGLPVATNIRRVVSPSSAT